MKSLFRYAAETRGFIVRVSVSFLPEQSEVGKGRWFWAYHIRIENEGLMAAQLLTRHWDIRDANGAHHLVGGAYDYVSGCPLTTPSGSMQGSYQMLGEDGSRFDIAIPKFALTTPVTAG